MTSHKPTVSAVVVFGAIHSECGTAIVCLRVVGLTARSLRKVSVIQLTYNDIEDRIS